MPPSIQPAPVTEIAPGLPAAAALEAGIAQGSIAQGSMTQVSISQGSIAVEAGPSVTLWSLAGATDADPLAAMRFQLQPEECAVIGRAEGGEVPYLDPRFTPTRIVPSTGRSVLTQGGKGTDISVSRGHFTLRGVGFGLVLINGVPRRGGGIRTPLNGTVMLEPQYRWLAAEEEFWIKPGNFIRIQLPNRTVIAIRAE